MLRRRLDLNPFEDKPMPDVEVEFRYPNKNYTRVMVKGSWDNWMKGTELELKEEDNTWKGIVKCYPKSHQYKFWTYTAERGDEPEILINEFDRVGYDESFRYENNQLEAKTEHGYIPRLMDPCMMPQPDVS
jgi:hypothetical protein